MNGQRFDLTPIIFVNFYPGIFWDVKLTQRFRKQYMSCFLPDINAAEYHKQKIYQSEIAKTLSIIARKDESSKAMLRFLAVNVDNCDIYVTIVPTLGDEYPFVLRKINKNTQDPMDYLENDCLIEVHYVLLIEDFQSMYTSKEQLKEIFQMNQIRILFFNDLLGYTNFA